jgi:ribosomal protein S18 acetylase RimI-like enzyme
VGASCRIRRGEARDEGWILGLGEELFGDLGDYREILGHWLKVPSAVTWVAEREAGLCGFSMVARRHALGFLWRPWVELVGIGTTPEARRCGVGRQLLGAATATGRDWHAREMRLHTALGNETGQAFFRASGFRSQPDGTAVYPSGERALPMVLLLV